MEWQEREHETARLRLQVLTPSFPSTSPHITIHTVRVTIFLGVVTSLSGSQLTLVTHHTISFLPVLLEALPHVLVASENPKGLCFAGAIRAYNEEALARVRPSS